MTERRGALCALEYYLKGGKGQGSSGDRLFCQGILLHGIRINWRCNVEGATMQEPLGGESFAPEAPAE